jgi:hypothetical protein
MSFRYFNVIHFFNSSHSGIRSFLSPTFPLWLRARQQTKGTKWKIPQNMKIQLGPGLITYVQPDTMTQNNMILAVFFTINGLQKGIDQVIKYNRELNLKCNLHITEILVFIESRYVN